MVETVESTQLGSKKSDPKLLGRSDTFLIAKLRLRNVLISTTNISNLSYTLHWCLSLVHKKFKKILHTVTRLLALWAAEDSVTLESKATLAKLTLAANRRPLGINR